MFRPAVFLLVACALAASTAGEQTSSVPMATTRTVPSRLDHFVNCLMHGAEGSTPRLLQSFLLS
jgi:hypothetical protein